MKKFRLPILFVLIALTFAAFKTSHSPASVVIIGGGPAGLATAIEAIESGAEVTVVEKRSAYERNQQLFLFDRSLSLLKKWEATPPELIEVEIADKRIGFVQISALERVLLRRAQELGVHVIQDKFIECSKKGRFAILEERGSVPYDILIAADGMHSLVRESLGIELILMGQGKAGAAFFPLNEWEPLNPIDISSPLQHESSFVRKFQFPKVTMIFLQGPVSAGKDDFIALCKASGWDFQAKQIEEDKALLLLDVDVYLQKASRFSLPDRRVLLVGDAAGTASFFRGRGANHALETAEIAGCFFKTADYGRFEAEMNKSANSLIEDSAFLFIPK